MKNKFIKKALSVFTAMAMMLSLMTGIPFGELGLGITASAAEALTVTIDTGASVTITDKDGDGYYDLGNADELYAFAAIVNGGNNGINAELTANITVNTDDIANCEGKNLAGWRTWKPIGKESDYKYNGVLNGNNYTISGIYCRYWPSDGCIGFIGYLGGSILNLTITNSYIYGGDHIGGLCGSFSPINADCTIYNCINEATVEAFNYRAGGICGDANMALHGCIKNCVNKGKILGEETVGGICGFQLGGVIESCYNTGTLNVQNTTVGGICGFIRGGEARSCLNLGTMTSPSQIGGVAGGGNNGIVSNCFYGTSGMDAIGSTYNCTINNSLSKTTAEFASGEVTYLLNGDQTTIMWYQTLGKDAYPSLDKTKGRVYYVYINCYDKEKVYTNDSKLGGDSALVDENNDGICDDCNAFVEPEFANRYYHITNAGNLMWFVSQVNEGRTTIDAKLTADIDMKDIDWTTMNVFAGTFDGNGHTISNLCADEDGGDDDVAAGSRCGLIQTLSEGGKVTGLTISGAQLWSANSAGAIAAVNNGTISKCIVKDSSIMLGASHGLAAIAGTNNGTVTDCGVVNCFLQRRYSAANSNAFAIGAVVEDNNGTVSNCFSYGCRFSNTPNAYAIVEGGKAPVNCYYYTGNTVSDTAATAKTKEQFASGEVAYLLNGGKTDGTQTWYQTIDTDAYPISDSTHKTVYKQTVCGEATIVYRNVNEPVHVYTHTVVPPTYYEQGYTLHECVGKDDSYKDSYTDKLVLSSVSGFATSDASADSISLSWNENSDASGYIIEQYVDGEWVQVADVTDNATTEYLVNGLIDATEYQFRIKAYITDGESIAYSEYSDSVSAVTMLATVSEFAICGTSADSISLLWLVNESANGYVIEQYVDGEWVQIADITDNATTEYLVNGLTADTEYQFRIKAYITDGESIAYSEYSDSVGAVTMLPAVSGFTSPSKSTTAIRLNWTADATVSGYIIEQMIDGYWVQIADITDNATVTYKVTDLTPGTAYKFRMFAYNDESRSDYTEELAVNTDMTTVKGFTSPSRSTSAIRLNWSKNAYATGYVIDQYTNSGWIQIADITDSEITTYKVTGLKSGTAYKFRMKAYSVTETGGIIYGNKTATLTVNTQASSVTGLALKSRSSTALRLKWTKNTAVDGYIIEQMIDGEWVQIADIDNYATTEYKVTGLSASTKYSFRMKSYAITKYGDKTYSSYTSTLSKTTNPSVVSGLRVKSKSDKAIRLAWTANTSADGYLIEQYIDGNWVQIADVNDIATTEYKVTGLASATEYQFRVRTYNTIGTTTLYSDYKTISGVTL